MQLPQGVSQAPIGFYVDRPGVRAHVRRPDTSDMDGDWARMYINVVEVDWSNLRQQWTDETAHQVSEALKQSLQARDVKSAISWKDKKLFTVSLNRSGDNEGMRQVALAIHEMKFPTQVTEPVLFPPRTRPPVDTNIEHEGMQVNINGVKVAVNQP